jgi:hypothetical protein
MDSNTRPWLQRPLNGELVLSPTVPLAWIFLLAFALAEIGNWRMGSEIARLCERVSPKDDIDAICRDRSPRTSIGQRYRNVREVFLLGAKTIVL